MGCCHLGAVIAALVMTLEGPWIARAKPVHLEEIKPEYYWKD